MVVLVHGLLHVLEAEDGLARLQALLHEAPLLVVAGREQLLALLALLAPRVDVFLEPVRMLWN